MTDSAPRRVLVLGGRGFIGSYAVKHLLAAGAAVTIGTRSPRADEAIEVPERQYVLHRALLADDWLGAAQDFDVVLNCVGILRQRFGETYDAVHHTAPAAIAQACASSGARFVHVSALGLSATARSRFLTSKFFGEQAIAKSGADWVIARLSLLDGDGGYGAAWLRWVAQLPLFVTPASATGDIAPLTADDTGRALTRLCLDSAEGLRLSADRCFELGGEDRFTFETYIRALRRRYSDQPALGVRVPGWLARLGAHLCDVFHFSPFSFGHWELLCADNVPLPNRLPELLRRAPDPVVPDSAPRLSDGDR